jgi:DNA (cytosine-5)-methyltransferase 1
MGYPEKFRIKNIGVSNTQLYRQFGNSVVVPVAKVIAYNMLALLKELENSTKKAELRET